MNEHDEALRKQTAFLGTAKGWGTLSFMQLCNLCKLCDECGN